MAKSTDNTDIFDNYEYDKCNMSNKLEIQLINKTGEKKGCTKDINIYMSFWYTIIGCRFCNERKWMVDLICRDEN